MLLRSPSAAAVFSMSFISEVKRPAHHRLQFSLSPSCLSPRHITLRHFSSRNSVKRLRGQKQEIDEEDEDEEVFGLDYRTAMEVQETELPPNGKTIEVTLLSRRMDQIISKSIGLSKTSLDKEIAKGSVRVNDEIATKKSIEMEAGDEIDVFDSPFEENEKLARVERLLVVKCPFDKQKGYLFDLRLWRNFITDNWKLQQKWPQPK